MRKTSTHYAVTTLLNLMAFQFNHRRSLGAYLKSDSGWINFTVGFRTEDNTVAAGIRFENGIVTALGTLPETADTTMIFADQSVIWEMLRLTPNEVVNLLMHNKIRASGSFVLLNLFNFYLSLVLGGIHRRMEKKRQTRQVAESKTFASEQSKEIPSQKADCPKHQYLKAAVVDAGVKHLEDPYLADISLNDFPRLKRALQIHFTKRPEICHERPMLLTKWFKENGFETDKTGRPWYPALRQGNAFKYLMTNKRPVIRAHDLLAGTTTAKEIGVVIYPDAHGTLIWGELHSAANRELNPYLISKKTADVLHNEVFPFWVDRNFREWVRNKFDNPLCQQLDERFAVYFVWKSVGISHTIPDFPSLLKLGPKGIIEKANHSIDRLESKINKQPQINELKAMIAAMEGLLAYLQNLADKAGALAKDESDKKRRTELLHMATVCQNLIKRPAGTLDEAVQMIWTAWIALHMENTNTGLSLGRLDLWLMPYFEADIKKFKTQKARRIYIHHVAELIGCLFMACTDHLPLIPDIGNYLFGGSSSDQAITLGGVTSKGKDAVCDMTYIFLKVTEMLAVRDPNVNARFHPGINSDAYLERLCEVNLNTNATPSLHNDEAVFASLRRFNYPEKDIRDWSATGCVEPTLSGKHMGHTGSMLMNMVAALEMALFDGRHPLMNAKVGPSTGSSFSTFDEFYDAFKSQFTFLMDQAMSFNNMLGMAHSAIRPSPLLSSLIQGCMTNGIDAVDGGAKYNSSGVAIIGLADVTDSLMVIKKLVFEQGKVTFDEMKKAVSENFTNHPALMTLLRNKVPLFGSGNPEALEMANTVAGFVSDHYGANRNFRGGPYSAGFWSMSNHVAFGTLAGALPSGRLAGKAFTPGLTPQPTASKNLLDNLRDVARLDPRNMSNNMAFNVKVVPGADDSHEEVVSRMAAYVKAYFEMGGMQMQMNVVTSDTLKHAMANPDAYRNLLVRISGYNAYFVTLNRDMQIELIERAEYGLS